MTKKLSRVRLCDKDRSDRRDRPPTTPASSIRTAFLASLADLCAGLGLELLAYPKATRSFVQQFLATTHIVTDFLLDEAIWQGAGAAYAAYAQRRRRSKDGLPKRLLVDFIVGAHAILKADRLLTLDAARYQVAFPKRVTLP